MAKLGNFVAQTAVPFTNAEMDAIKSYITDLVKRNYDCTIDDNAVMSVIKDEELNSPYRYGNHATVTVRFMLNNSGMFFRSHGDGNVYNILGFEFVICKQGGYLEVQDIDGNLHKDWDNAPTFLYSGNFNVIGWYRKYRARTHTSLYMGNSYQYGTELADLDFRDCILQLYRITLGK